MVVCHTEAGIPFGLLDGRPKDIADVKSGKKCGCVCPACKSDLIAKKGDILRHHFAHATGASCSTGLQTSIHIAAKDMVRTIRHIRTPPNGNLSELRYRSDWVKHSGRPPHTQSWLFPSESIELSNVQPEQRILIPGTDRWIIPDLTCNNGELLIEFLVSHEVDNLKTRLIEQLQHQCIEIDLRPFIHDWLQGDRRSELGSASAQLRELLLNSDQDRRWVCDSRVAEWLKEHRIPDYPSNTGQQLDLLRDDEARPRHRDH
ncbi:MAG: hypothetical protein KA788_13360 [Lacunisphaera sp.]|jgi:hypothetical protein|nr:hypothetical protein [Lacunisphaera sp.]